MAARPLTPADVVASRLPEVDAQVRAGNPSPILFWPPFPRLDEAGRVEVEAALAAAGYMVISWCDLGRDKKWATLRRKDTQ
jgi:hypothetical protein